MIANYNIRPFIVLTGLNGTKKIAFIDSINAFYESDIEKSEIRTNFMVYQGQPVPIQETLAVVAELLDKENWRYIHEYTR